MRHKSCFLFEKNFREDSDLKCKKEILFIQIAEYRTSITYL